VGKVVSPSLSEIAKLRTPLTPGERSLLNLFATYLSDDWQIYTQPFLNGCRPDFVLLNPSVGIGVFEVKDTDLTKPGYTDEVRSKMRNPVLQVRSCADEISTLYCPRLRSNRIGIAITAGAVFPVMDDDLVRSHYGKFQVEYDRYGRQVGPHVSLAGRRTLEGCDLETILPNCRDEHTGYLSEEAVKDLQSWLMEPEYSAEQRFSFVLDGRQGEFATSRTATGCRRIRGSAGSGKSVVLCRRAANLAQQGKDVLVVAFNRTLPNYLRDVCSRLGTNPNKGIVWMVFHDWLKRTMYDEDMRETYKDDWQTFFSSSVDNDDLNELLNEGLPRKLIELKGSRQGGTFDAILVDEGQDFSIIALRALKQYLRPNGEFLVIEDRLQDIYERGVKMDRAYSGLGFGPWSELKNSHRLPSTLIDPLRKFALQTLSPEEELLPNRSDDQPSLNITPCTFHWKQVLKHELSTEAVEAAFDIIRGDNRGELSMADLTILVPSKATGREVVQRLQSKDFGMKVTTTFSTDGEGGDTERRLKIAFRKGHPSVKVTTPHSFKGWEARLLVVCIEHARSKTDFSLIYTAMSRLKAHPQGSHLTVVCCEDRLAGLGAELQRDANARQAANSRCRTTS
jgi:hypothetical protein